MGASRCSCGSRTCGSVGLMGRAIPIVFVLSLTVVALSMGRKEAAPRDSTAVSATPSSGIRGRVEVWEGNFMPMVSPGRSSGTILSGAGRRIRVYEAVRMGAQGLAQARRDTVTTPLVAETVCDSSGRFLMAVPPGTYSVFVEESGGWYYNGWNNDGVQGAVTVYPDSISDIVIKITTKATF
jgi:hypothetical protein